MPEHHFSSDKQGDNFEADQHESPADLDNQEEPETKPGSHHPRDESYNYEILFIMNHQFVDGISGHDLIYKQFIPILNKIINNLPVDNVFLTPHDVTPSYEEDILSKVSTADQKPSWYIKAYFNLLRAKNRAFGGNDARIKVTAEGSPFLDQREWAYSSFVSRRSLWQGFYMSAKLIMSAYILY